jgi:predicted AlkP superfamily pyrophosphatase or phosphodiesterase
MSAKLEYLNEILGYLIDELKKHHLFDKLNLVITSDHGMDTISNNTVIFLDSYIDINLFNAYGSRACYSIFVKNCKYKHYFILKYYLLFILIIYSVSNRFCLFEIKKY